MPIMSASVRDSDLIDMQNARGAVSIHNGWSPPELEGDPSDNIAVSVQILRSEDIRNADPHFRAAEACVHDHPNGLGIWAKALSGGCQHRACAPGGNPVAILRASGIADDGKNQDQREREQKVPCLS